MRVRFRVEVLQGAAASGAVMSLVFMSHIVLKIGHDNQTITLQAASMA